MSETIKINADDLLNYKYDFIEMSPYHIRNRVITISDTSIGLEVDLTGFERGALKLAVINSSIGRLAIKNSNVEIDICNVDIGKLEIQKCGCVYIDNAGIDSIDTDKCNLLIGYKESNKTNIISNISIMSKSSYGARLIICSAKIKNILAVGVEEIKMKNTAIRNIKASRDGYIDYGIKDSAIASAEINAAKAEIMVANNYTDYKTAKLVVNADKIELSNIFTKAIPQFNGKLDISKYIIGKRLINEIVYAKHLSYLCIKDISKSEAKIILDTSERLELDRLGNDEIVGETGGELVINKSIYISNISYVEALRKFTNKNRILTYFGTQAYYFLLTNRIPFELLDKVPEKIVREENKIRLMQGNIIDAILNENSNIVSIYDKTNYKLDGINIEIPNTVKRAIEFLDYFQSADTIFRNTDEINNTMKEVCARQVTGDVKYIEYMCINNSSITANVIMYNRVVLKAVILYGKISLENVLTEYTHSTRFYDLIVNNIGSSEQCAIGIKNDTQYKGNIRDITLLMRLVLNGCIKYNFDSILICSNGFAKFRLVRRPHIGNCYINSGYIKSINAKRINRKDLGLGE